MCRNYFTRFKIFLSASILFISDEGVHLREGLSGGPPAGNGFNLFGEEAAPPQPYKLMPLTREAAVKARPQQRR